ncbi:MAG: hypothetical protein KF767_02365 [Bdellovibrionaceae bacterium]|nr:hypothetical protein [Pseudobdellovibrionaceae bacterium]
MILRHEDSYSTPIWIGVGLVGLFIAGLMVIGPRTQQARKIMSAEDVSYSYEMARIEQEEGAFDLSGRDVHRRKRELEAYEAKKKAALKGVMAGSGAHKGPAKPNVKAVAIKASAAAMAAAEAARMKVDTVGESERYKRMRASAQGVDSAAYANAYPQNYVPQATTKTATTSTEKKDEEPKLTPEQWRSLLQVAPTALNVSKLIAARNRGDISEDVVLEIAKDLLKDSGDERQQAGLSIADRMVSAKTFEFMVLEKSEFSQDVQTELQKKIESYGLPARLTYLGPVLVSANEDKSAVLVAMNLIEASITEYRRLQSGQITQSANAPSLAQLQVFLATLRRVGETGEGSLAEQAKSLSTSIAELKPLEPKKSGLTGRPMQTAGNER